MERIPISVQASHFGLDGDGCCLLTGVVGE
ncbi:MAG: hypothetical protein UY50_C0008G0024 [Parcubacteria group bacterium GW2011_GWA2_49_9]|nr:MAG: hypothetical protein UY50_C0008G0024 [Parcubacteria group bacterium GW2011_GWA2_49_9]